MEVYSISSYKPQFTGYVDSSVSKYISKAIRNECSNLFRNKNFNYDKVDELDEYGDEILTNFAQYMRKTHKNTKFTLGNTNFSNFPRFKNPISSHTVRIYSPSADGEPHMDKFGEIAMPNTLALKPRKKANIEDLNKLNDFYNKLEKINPKDIDHAFYDAERRKMCELSDGKIGFFARVRMFVKDLDLIHYLKQITKSDKRNTSW